MFSLQGKLVTLYGLRKANKYVRNCFHSGDCRRCLPSRPDRSGRTVTVHLPQVRVLPLRVLPGLSQAQLGRGGCCTSSAPRDAVRRRRLQ